MSGGSIGSVFGEMSVRPVHRVRRTLVLVTLAVAATACGGRSEQPAADPIPSDNAAEAVQGSELAGVRFDVRRDPG